MKKLTILLSLAFISCGKFKQQDVLFKNDTTKDIVVQSDDLSVDMMVLHDGGEYVKATKGNYTFHAFTDDGSVDYVESFEVKKDDLIINLHE